MNCGLQITVPILGATLLVSPVVCSGFITFRGFFAPVIIGGASTCLLISLFFVNVPKNTLVDFAC